MAAVLYDRHSSINVAGRPEDFGQYESRSIRHCSSCRKSVCTVRTSVCHDRAIPPMPGFFAPNENTCDKADVARHHYRAKNAQQVWVEAMTVEIRSIDLSIETKFKSPSFALWTEGLELLKDLHGRLGLETELDSSDMHYQTGTRLSDVRVIVSLFGDRASIEIRSDKSNTAFKNLKTLEDHRLCRTCIGRAQQAVKATLPDVTELSSNVQMAVHIKFEDRSQFITQRTQSASSAIHQHSFRALGDVIEPPRWHIDIENPQEIWASSLTLMPSPAENEMILHGYVLYYWPNPRLHETVGCLDHSLIVLKSVLASLDLSPSTQLSEPGLSP